MEDPWWRRFLAHLIALSLIIGGVLVGAYLGLALADTNATGEESYWPIVFDLKLEKDTAQSLAEALGAIIGLVLGYFVFPFLMRVTGLVSERTLQKMRWKPTYSRRTQAETSQREEPRWRRFLACLIAFSLIIGGGIVGLFLGIALVETIATGENAFWPFDFHHQYATDLSHGVAVVFGLSIGCGLGAFVFLFLMRVTRLVSERTVEKMFERYPGRKRRRLKRFD